MSQLASLHLLRWSESPWDPSWGEERNGNHLVPSQGCRADGTEPQTSASPEHQSLCEQCAVLYCHAATKSAMLTAYLNTPSAVGFLLFQCTELNWQYSRLPKIMSCKLFVSPKKKVKRVLTEDGTVLNFFRRGDEVCLYCMLSRFSSGSKWCIHDSSPVTIFKRNWSPSSQ